MREAIRDGVKVWEPVDVQDRALLAIAEGSTFNSTTLPSGWVTPPGEWVCRNGMLVPLM